VTTSSPAPTSGQLNYLRALAQRTGTTFATPRTRAEASAEINRLKGIRTTGFTFAELQAEQAARQAHGDTPIDAAAFRADEIQGHGSTCTWSQRA
jgi:hypothetical protein